MLRVSSRRKVRMWMRVEMLVWSKRNARAEKRDSLRNRDKKRTQTRSCKATHIDASVEIHMYLYIYIPVGVHSQSTGTRANQSFSYICTTAVSRRASPLIMYTYEYDVCIYILIDRNASLWNSGRPPPQLLYICIYINECLHSNKRTAPMLCIHLHWSQCTT